MPAIAGHFHFRKERKQIEHVHREPFGEVQGRARGVQLMRIE